MLTALGNPANMGFCIACFERDIAGAVGLHSAAKVQYVRPEIIGLVLGSFLMALASKRMESQSRFVSRAPLCARRLRRMIGALAFLGCPLRMVLRLAGGDLNAVVGLAGFAAGIFLGTIFIRKGFTLQRNYATKTLDGTVLPAVMVGLLILFLAVPTLFKLSEEGPGSKHAPFLIALLIALVVGALAQKSRICMVGRSARHDDVQGSAPAVGLHRHFRHSPHRQSLPA
ncbi:MAG: YedE family putative selenium transporter [Oscillospiraceae bacterium]